MRNHGRNCPTDAIVENYRSQARILLLGMGADEQMAGYGRHRTTFRKAGWSGLREELKRERSRLWLRNLGRDDRVVSDWGREARFPFLDEQVMHILSEFALPLVCDLTKELGAGDKLVLRTVARNLGLVHCAALQKRAIQFGTRIANRNVYGGAKVRGDMDISELVHPLMAGRTGTRIELHKKWQKREKRTVNPVASHTST